MEDKISATTPWAEEGSGEDAESWLQAGVGGKDKSADGRGMLTDWPAARRCSPWHSWLGRLCRFLSSNIPDNNKYAMTVGAHEHHYTSIVLKTANKNHSGCPCDQSGGGIAWRSALHIRKRLLMLLPISPLPTPMLVPIFKEYTTCCNILHLDSPSATETHTRTQKLCPYNTCFHRPACLQQAPHNRSNAQLCCPACCSKVYTLYVC